MESWRWTECILLYEMIGLLRMGVECVGLNITFWMLSLQLVVFLWTFWILQEVDHWGRYVLRVVNGQKLSYVPHPATWTVLLKLTAEISYLYC